MTDTSNTTQQNATGNMATTILQTAAPMVLGIVAKKWPKSLTIVSALVGASGAGIAAWQAYQAKDMTTFGGAIAAIFGSAGAIVGRVKANQPIG